MRPIQPSAFQYLLPQLVQSGANTQTSGASGWTPGGALSLQIPDNTRIGGNPRGLGAVDLQTQRNAATQVASGAGSFVMGFGSTASGTRSFAMGEFSTASGDYSAAMGTSNASNSSATAFGSSTASNTYSTAMGQGTASGSYASAMGLSNATSTGATAMGLSTASGSYSFACGRSIAAQVGKFANSGGVFSTTGDSQTGMIVVRATTSTNTTVVLTSDGNPATTTNQLIVSTNQAMAFTGELIGKQSGSANTVAYEIKGRLVNNAGTVTMPTGTLTLIGTDDITLDTAPTLAADNTNKGLTVTSGAKTTTNIRWVCTLRSTEVVYA